MCVPVLPHPQTQTSMSVKETNMTASPASIASTHWVPLPVSVRMDIARLAQNALVRLSFNSCISVGLNMAAQGEVIATYNDLLTCSNVTLLLSLRHWWVQVQILPTSLCQCPWLLLLSVWTWFPAGRKQPILHRWVMPFATDYMTQLKSGKRSARHTVYFPLISTYSGFVKVLTESL